MNFVQPINHYFVKRFRVHFFLVISPRSHILVVFLQKQADLTHLNKQLTVTYVWVIGTLERLDFVHAFWNDDFEFLPLNSLSVSSSDLRNNGRHFESSKPFWCRSTTDERSESNLYIRTFIGAFIINKASYMPSPFPVESTRIELSNWLSKHGKYDLRNYS